MCHQRPAWKKPLYGHPVCKKCYYRLANRRQLEKLGLILNGEVILSLSSRECPFIVAGGVAPREHLGGLVPCLPGIFHYFVRFGERPGSNQMMDNFEDMLIWIAGV